MSTPAWYFVVGVATSIVTSFTQSLGLTLQRKSHVATAARAAAHGEAAALPYYRRPLWLGGFALFLASSFGGSTVAISLLPVTILAPLGAVTLVSNALFAKWLLDDHFNRQALLATVLVVLGGLLIGVFGALPLPAHDLADLIRLYKRPAFIAFFTVTEALAGCFLLAIYLLRPRRRSGHGPARPAWAATPLSPTTLQTTGQVHSGPTRSYYQACHTTNVPAWPHQPSVSWDQLLEEEARLPSPVVVIPKSSIAAFDEPSQFPARLRNSTADPSSSDDRPGAIQSHPPEAGSSRSSAMSATEAYPSEDSASASSGSAPEHVPLAEAIEVRNPSQSYPSPTPSPLSIAFQPAPAYSFRMRRRSGDRRGIAGWVTRTVRQATKSRALTFVRTHRETLRGLLYGVVSGMLCSQSLLFAKSGIELLLVTLAGQENQFTGPLAWFILFGLLVTSLAQLYFLNRSLELCSTLVIAPLTFCSYNLSTLLNGLVYYDQFQLLAPHQLALVLVGSVILSAGVFILSIGLTQGRPGVNGPAPALPTPHSIGDHRRLSAVASDDDDRYTVAGGHDTALGLPLTPSPPMASVSPESATFRTRLTLFTSMYNNFIGAVASFGSRGLARLRPAKARRWHASAASPSSSLEASESEPLLSTITSTADGCDGHRSSNEYLNRV
ncbi:hypothetical protein IWQ60_010624 [Tieghemiomyces parasiticus]|uniref:Uncharacterized protein n=1 Tax=Tieghemiomyces parasiticus TaxID=78921 RepID=A0A9W8DMP6_9FUNG|nr:hypothetical protein IWQ60_010624 [Tieghemiomyces parasiticus]